MRAARLGAAVVAVAALAAAGGCKSQPGAVDLTITADSSLPDATVAAIGVLDISVSGAASTDQSYLLSTPFASSRQERLLIRPPVSSGMLSISVLARAATGDALGYGQTSVTLKSGGAVSAQVILTSDIPADAGSGGVDGGVGDMAAGGGGPSVSLLAGHLGGTGFADATGAAARFNMPRGGVVVGGKLYVADMYNHVIRAVDLATGAVSTLAGSPMTDGSADGTGAAARFKRPHGITTDGQGNLYVTDMRNDTIRKIVIATGAVTTLAGSPGNGGSTDGTGSAARFDHPHGIACDGTNLYVADTYNHTIRQIVISSAVVTTLAGTAGTRGSANGTGTAATFNSPHDLAFDGGNLYVADTLNHEIRQIAVSGAAVTTLAGSTGGGQADGTGTNAHFQKPRGIVADGMGDLYVADSDNDRVRKIVISGAVVTTLAGHDYGPNDGVGAGAGFEGPMGIAFDPSGFVYALDGWGDTVRKVAAASGVVTTVAGTAGANGYADGSGAAALFNRPHGICVVGGAVYVADKMNNVVRKVDLATGATTTLAGSGVAGSANGAGAAARFNQPFGLASDGANQLFVSDASNHTIRAIDLTSGAVTTLAGSAGSAGTTNGTGSAARFNTPAGLAYAGGNLYVADQNNHAIRQIVVATGAVTTPFGTAGSAGAVDDVGAAARFNRPNGLAIDGGALYVADQNNQTIRKIDLTTGAVTTLAGTAGMRGSADGVGAAAQFAFPHALAADGMGSLYVADTINSTVRKIDLATATVTTFAGQPGVSSVAAGPVPALLNTPSGLAVAPGGGLVITTTHENGLLLIK